MKLNDLMRAANKSSSKKRIVSLSPFCCFHTTAAAACDMTPGAQPTADLVTI